MVVKILAGLADSNNPATQLLVDHQYVGAALKPVLLAESLWLSKSEELVQD